jgi:hypothetical protein
MEIFRGLGLQEAVEAAAQREFVQDGHHFGGRLKRQRTRLFLPLDEGMSRLTFQR